MPTCQHGIGLIGIAPQALPTSVCVCAPCDVAPTPARRSGGVGAGKGLCDGGVSIYNGDPNTAKASRSDIAVQTDDVSGRSMSGATRCKKRFTQGRTPAFPAMGNHASSDGLRPYDHAGERESSTRSRR